MDCNNKNIKFYRNGILFYAYTTTNTILFPNLSKTKFINDTTYGIKGPLSDIRIYNRGLSAEEVNQIYNQTRGRYQ